MPRFSGADSPRAPELPPSTSRAAYSSATLRWRESGGRARGRRAGRRPEQGIGAFGDAALRAQRVEEVALGHAVGLRERGAKGGPLRRFARGDRCGLDRQAQLSQCLCALLCLECRIVSEGRGVIEAYRALHLRARLASEGEAVGIGTTAGEHRYCQDQRRCTCSRSLCAYSARAYRARAY